MFHPPHHTLECHVPGDNSAPPIATFGVFAEALRQDLAPSGPLESLLAERAILAAWHLHRATQAEGDRLRNSSSKRTPRRPSDAIQRRLDREQHRLEKSLDLLQTLRERRPSRWGQSAPLASAPVASRPDDRADDNPVSLSNEWPNVPPTTPFEGFEDEAAETDEVSVRWQDRLIIDPNVSETSPVVRGTWVTVSQIVALVVDGWTWSDILRTHPELTEDDIRSCLAYTVEHDHDDASC